MKNILVTGAGAVLGQGILRCLQEEKNKIFIHTADPDYRSPGHWLGNKAHIVKMAKDSTYIDSIENILSGENIDLVFIGTDTELPIFSLHKERLEKKYNTIIVVSDLNIINIANDKFLTAQFLKEHNFPFPNSIMSSDKIAIEILKNQANYPYIAKPIDGARSKGVELINSSLDLDRVSSFVNNLVIQEFITDYDGEYTSGCLVFNGKCKAVVTLKRDLRDGNTNRAYYNKTYDQYNSFISKVAETLGIEGPSNFQFRIKDKLPIIFEINSRFSGTTPLRYFFGFNEVKACIDYYLHNIEVGPYDLKPGLIMRVWSDIFVKEEQINDLKSTGVLNNPNSTYYSFKKI